jgi:hypothetical protein
MAPSTPGRLLVHGVGSSLPKVAGRLGREAMDDDGAGIGGAFTLELSPTRVVPRARRRQPSRLARVADLGRVSR